MSDFESFARHVKADLLIFHGLWSDMSCRVDAGADAMEQMQVSFQEMQRAQVDTRDILRQVVGHARQSGERMDAILGAMHREFPHTSDLEELRLRVEALERKLAS